jgi:hypothetical protein
MPKRYTIILMDMLFINQALSITNELICTEGLEAVADMYITKPIDFYHLTTNILPHLINTNK